MVVLEKVLEVVAQEVVQVVKMYKRKWHKYLFEYNLVHSTIAQKVYCEKANNIEKKYLDELESKSKVISDILLRIYNGYKTEFNDVIKYVPEFQLKDKILNLNREVEPPLWTRYDAFFDKKGVFFAEFNYDKPCAEREAFFMEDCINKNNVNYGFQEKFINAVINKLSGKRNLAILCSDEYEEVHLGYLFKRQLKYHAVNTIIVKKNNLKVLGEKVYAFNNEVDTILRLYPTEKLHEVNDIDEILKLYDNNKVDIINDPRVIILQSKEIFIYLRNLIDSDGILNYEEKEVIKTTIPKSKILKEKDLINIIDNPKGILIKPVLGRYSRDIFLPEKNNREKRQLLYVYLSKRIKEEKYLIQEYRNIVGQYIPYYDGNELTTQYGYGNYGVFIIDGTYIGYATRWCTTPITNEWLSWTTPLSYYNPVIRYYNKEFNIKHMNKEAIFKYNFTGTYSSERIYLDNRVLLIDEYKASELIEATESLCKVFCKVKRLVNKNIGVFKNFLGLNKVIEFIKEDSLDTLGYLGRLDWIVDCEGNLKVIEINSETPAGLNEALNIEKLYLERLDKSFKSLNNNFESLIINEFNNIIKEYSRYKDIKTVAILGCTYYEDWYNNDCLYKILKSNIKNIEFVQGNIYDLRIEDNKAYIYGKELDCIYRYFPLDWFVEEDIADVKDGLGDNFFFVNSSNTIITQSKGFLAVIYELLKQEFFEKHESEIIKKYIPYTSFNVEDFKEKEYIYKPILGREGQGVEFLYDNKEDMESLGIYQEVVCSQKVRSNVVTALGEVCEDLYPVVGTYIVDDKFGGVYTRVGELITDKDCQYAPLLVRN